jgi:propionyl-CoA carboxylase beta chain
MSSRHVRGDFNVAWPTAEIAVMGPKGAVEILFKREIAESDDPDAAMDARVAEYREKFAHPYIAASRGYVDDIIDPRDTRPRLIDALETMRAKRDRNPPRKHGNIPL